MTTLLFFVLYICILIVDLLELGYILKCAKMSAKDGYIELKENDKVKNKEQNK